MVNIDNGAGYPAGVSGLPFPAAGYYQAVTTTHVDLFETDSQNGYVQTSQSRVVFTKENDYNLATWKTSNGYMMVAGTYQASA